MNMNSFKASLIMLLIPFITNPSFSQTTLSAGDIAIIGWNSDDVYASGQRWAFVTFVNLSSGTVIHFTDNGYDGSTSQFRTGATNEGHLSITFNSSILAGTIIYGTNTSLSTTISGASVTVSGKLGGTAGGFSTAGDQIIAYQGTAGTASGATFIYAVNTGQSSSYASLGAWITSGSISASDVLSYIPPGLTNGTTAVALTSNVGNTSSGTGSLGSSNYGFDNMYYGGATIGTKASLLAALGNSSNWIGHNSTTWNIASGGVFPITDFTISGVAPVNLISYNAKGLPSGNTFIGWSTAQEINNSHFTIERSDDAIHYKEIGSVQGKGDFYFKSDYSFIDYQPLIGTNYYRLKQFDFDGTMKILGIKIVKTQPAEENIQVTYLHGKDVQAIFSKGIFREVRLLNSTGTVLQNKAISMNDNRVDFDISLYAKGIFYLQFVRMNNTPQTKKFIKN